MSERRGIEHARRKAKFDAFLDWATLACITIIGIGLVLTLIIVIFH